MNTVFFTPGCPICAEIEIAAIFSNLRLPIDSKIDFVSVHGGSGKLSFLSELTEGPDYVIPNTFLDILRNINGKIVTLRTRLLGASYRDYNSDVINLIHSRETF